MKIYVNIRCKLLQIVARVYYRLRESVAAILCKLHLVHDSPSLTPGVKKGLFTEHEHPL